MGRFADEMGHLRRDIERGRETRHTLIRSLRQSNGARAKETGLMMSNLHAARMESARRDAGERARFFSATAGEMARKLNQFRKDRIEGGRAGAGERSDFLAGLHQELGDLLDTFHDTHDQGMQRLRQGFARNAQERANFVAGTRADVRQRLTDFQQARQEHLETAGRQRAEETRQRAAALKDNLAGVRQWLGEVNQERLKQEEAAMQERTAAVSRVKREVAGRIEEFQRARHDGDLNGTNERHAFVKESKGAAEQLLSRFHQQRAQTAKEARVARSAFMHGLSQEVGSLLRSVREDLAMAHEVFFSVSPVGLTGTAKTAEVVTEPETGLETQPKKEEQAAEPKVKQEAEGKARAGATRGRKKKR